MYKNDEIALLPVATKPCKGGDVGREIEVRLERVVRRKTALRLRGGQKEHVK